MNTWWWNSGVKDEIKKRKKAYKNSNEKNEYKIEKAAKKAVARAMKEEAERKINELGRNPNNVDRLVTKMKIESTDVVRGRCM